MTSGILIVAIAAQLAAAGADLVTTQRCLSSGRGLEANAVMRGGRGPGIKIGVSLSLTAGSVRLWKTGKKRQAVALQLVPAAAWGAVAVHNARVCR